MRPLHLNLNFSHIDLTAPVSRLAFSIRANVSNTRSVPPIEPTGVQPRASEAIRGVQGPVDSTPMVSGIGVSTVLEANWPYLNVLVDGVVVSSLEETADAIRSLAKSNHLVVEGAGAVALAAARRPYFVGKRVAAVLTGGGIDSHVLASVLNGVRAEYLPPSRIRNYE